VGDAAAGRSRTLAVLRALRVHQWVKNLLVLVPILLDHRLSDPDIVLRGLIAFLAFCLAASGGYVVNDLMDLEADRHHPDKRDRPFASSDLPAAFGMVLAPLLLLSAVVIGALLLPDDFLGLLLLYIVLTIAYSAYLKRIAVLDVLLLAGLYTLRVLAGVAASGVRFSTWLLAFAMFLFLSLAFLKRHAEILALAPDQHVTSRRRGYLAGDVSWLGSTGSTSGYLAVLVLALYLNSDDVMSLYRKPAVLFLICPLLLFWTGWMWLQAHRGQIHEDPIVASARDPASYIVAALVVLVLYAAL
jgi:4-hydroxybenzoate polyprenyltransferase